MPAFDQRHAEGRHVIRQKRMKVADATGSREGLGTMCSDNICNVEGRTWAWELRSWSEALWGEAGAGCCPERLKGMKAEAPAPPLR